MTQLAVVINPKSSTKCSSLVSSAQQGAGQVSSLFGIALVKLETSIAMLTNFVYKQQVLALWCTSFSGGLPSWVTSNSIFASCSLQS